MDPGQRHRAANARRRAAALRQFPSYRKAGLVAALTIHRCSRANFPPQGMSLTHRCLSSPHKRPRPPPYHLARSAQRLASLGTPHAHRRLGSGRAVHRIRRRHARPLGPPQDRARPERLRRRFRTLHAAPALKSLMVTAGVGPFRVKLTLHQAAGDVAAAVRRCLHSARVGPRPRPLFGARGGTGQGQWAVGRRGEEAA